MERRRQIFIGLVLLLCMSVPALAFSFSDLFSSFSESLTSITGNQISGSQCDDGIDNDGDGLTDWEFDLGCYGPEDNSEGGPTINRENGWTTFNPSSDTRIVYVSSIDGDNANDGLSPQTPKRTVYDVYDDNFNLLEVGGYGVLRDGYPDWLLLKRGDVFDNQRLVGTWWKSGRSATERMVVSSYGSSINRPLIRSIDMGGSFYSNGMNNLAFIGMHMEGGTHVGDEAGVAMLGSGSNILWEDIVVSDFVTGFIVDAQGSGYSNFELRRSQIYENWKPTENGQAFYAVNIHDAVIEENLLDYNGWNEGNSPLTVFDHSMYFNEGIPYAAASTGITVRDNLVLRGDGIQMRTGGLAENNFFYAVTIPLLLGGGNEPIPGGVTGVIRDNVITQSRVIGGLPRGWTFSVGNIVDMDIERNLAFEAESMEHNSLFSYSHQVGDDGGIRPLQNIRLRNNIYHNWRGGIYAAYDMSFATMENNVIQDLSGPTPIPLMDYTHPSQLPTASGNSFYRSSPESQWFAGASSFDQFVNDLGGSGNVRGPVTFSDSGRTVESYMSTLGESATEGRFFSILREQSRLNWRYELTANAINNYFREGFDMAQLDPDSTSTGGGGPAPVCGNGAIEAGEYCDDGNTNNGDGCSSICRVESPQQSGDECDDGIDNDGDGLVDWEYDLGCFGPEDTSEGGASNVLENGWTTFSPSSDSRIIYVSSSDGNDANDGLSPQRAKRTIAAGYGLLRDGYPDWLLLKRGDTFNEVLWYYNYDKDGRSASEPLVIASYGSSTERPRIIPGGETAVMTGGTDTSYIAFTGLYLQGSAQRNDGNEIGIYLLSNGREMLFEDLVITGFADGFDINSATGIHDVTFRRNHVFENYYNTPNAQGMFIGNAHNLLIEENVIDYNGWGDSRPLSVFDHSIYLSEGPPNGASTGVVVRGNMIMRADGIQMRTGGLAQDNLFYRTAIAMMMGEADAPVPGGVSGAWLDNVIIDGEDIGGLPRGWAFRIANINSQGLDIARNVVAHNTAHVDFRTLLRVEQPHLGISNVVLRDNVIHNWRSPLFTGSQTANIHLENNVIQDTDAPFDTPIFQYSSASDLPSGNGNQFYRPTSSSTWFGGWDSGDRVPISTFISDFGDSSMSQSEQQFSDPGRSVDTYMGSLGYPATESSFISQIRQQSRFNWRHELTANAVNNYIRAGFDMPAVDSSSGGSTGGNTCGNGILEAGESCDDGNTQSGDGCSLFCISETSSSVCGNGVLEFGETCDDGNTFGGDGCSSLCTTEVPASLCGNGVVESGESCDDGNTQDGDGCSAICELEPITACGNGVLEAGETCDDGNIFDGDGCSSFCTNEVSGGVSLLYMGADAHAPSYLNLAQSFAASRGNSLAVEQRVRVGENLRAHWEANHVVYDTWGELVEGYHDYMILSTIQPINTDDTMLDTEHMTYHFSYIGFAENPDFVPILLEVWPDAPYGTAAWRQQITTDHSVWETIVNNANNGNGVSGVQLLEVASVFGYLHDQVSTLSSITSTADLFQANGVSNLGEYFVGLVIYTHLFGDDPQGLPTLGVSAAQAGDLQRVVAQYYGFSIQHQEQCGDGVIEGSEICDGGSRACSSGGYAGSQACRTSCDGFDVCFITEYCGDGIVNGDEACDDGNSDEFDGCTSLCQVGPTSLCGNGITETSEVCDGGVQPCTLGGYLGNQQCLGNCFGYTACFTTENCGDGIINGAEVCDGNSQPCTFNGYEGERSCSASCSGFGACIVPGYCGDGIVNGNEGCDDGNTLDNDGCENCVVSDIEVCGNGVLETGEVCDGNTQVCTLNGYTGVQSCVAGCRGYGSCVVASFCGDGIVNGPEACDDGNQDETDGCTSSCQLAQASVCGNGIIDLGEVCDGQTQACSVGGYQGTYSCANDCQSYGECEATGFCGNLVVDGYELCDGGTRACYENGYLGFESCADHCFDYDYDCVLTEFCGDGTLNGLEECDDGNLANGDGCSSNCTVQQVDDEPLVGEVCGDGLLNDAEVCDGENRACSLGGYAGFQTCHASCERFEGCVPTEFCGDGIVNGDEECDDQNVDEDDGCTSSCLIKDYLSEIDPDTEVCGNGVVETGEECDDGNRKDSDDCTNSCTEGYCGDGYLQDSEACDDSNKESGDGCSLDCVAEPGYECFGLPSSCEEVFCPSYAEGDLPYCVSALCTTSSSTPIFTLNDASCDDGDPCTIDLCSRNGCKHEPDESSPGCSFEQCKDADDDGVLDYDAISCLSGKDKCIQHIDDYEPATKEQRSIRRSKLFDVAWDDGNKDVKARDLRIRKDGRAKVAFKEKVSMVTVDEEGCFKPIILDTVLEVGENRVFLDSENLPELDAPAEITFYGVNYKNPEILKDGKKCTECVVVKYNAGEEELTFKVKGFSEYIVVEAGTSAPVPTAAAIQNTRQDEASTSRSSRQDDSSSSAELEVEEVAPQKQSYFPYLFLLVGLIFLLSGLALRLRQPTVQVDPRVKQAEAEEEALLQHNVPFQKTFGILAKKGYDQSTIAKATNHVRMKWYIQSSRKKGFSDKDIRAMLIKGGCSKEDVEAVFVSLK